MLQHVLLNWQLRRTYSLWADDRKSRSEDRMDGHVRAVRWLVRRAFAGSRDVCWRATQTGQDVAEGNVEG